jgi:MYXO-CTERM domain-containing protein
MPARLPRLLRVIAPALLLATTGTASAVAPRDHRTDDAIVATDGARLRQGIDVTADVPPVRQRAWDAFTARTGGAWRATWDRATGVPSRLYGGSVHVPGANADARIAEQAARRFLAEHGELLAPGVTAADLELVANHDDGRIRSIGFRQRHGGLVVVGGQISVRFLNDRIYVVSSQIVPVGALAYATVRDHRALANEALAATTRELGLGTARASAAAEPVILPLIADDEILGFRLALPVDVDAGLTGRWTVFADVTTGEPLVRVDRVRRADGTLLFDVPVRYPAAGRADMPAARARITVDGSAVTTGVDGVVTWSREAQVPLITSVAGDLVTVRHTNVDEGVEATASLTITPAGTTRWSAPDDEAIDAQLTTFVHTQVVKNYARTFITDPTVIQFLDLPIVATVNIDQDCNAFYTRVEGVGTINFFVSSSQCENTGRLPDVVYHEFGHGVHDYSVIPGVGLIDGAMGEGAADFLAAMITGDHGMGRGFFKNDEPLRDLDEEGRERIWPDDVGEIHITGIIFGGAFWDLRTAAIAQLGETEGTALVQRLYVAALQRSTDIPSSLIEAIAADDDDGDLSNGTPHECLIREAFARHGLRTVAATLDAPGQVADAAATTAQVTVSLSGLSAACVGDEVDHVTVEWDHRFDSDSPVSGDLTLTANVGDVYTGEMPLPGEGDVMSYRFHLYFTDGTSLVFPDNRGDPFYELHRGPLIDLYCTDFETDPFAEGWTHGASGQSLDMWQWGMPLGLGGDPAEAYSGTNVLGMALDEATDGKYVPGVNTWVKTPVVDVGKYSDVRLQYRRWLGVEDGFYDKATIWANNEIAWQNKDSGQSLDASAHTRDKEWVFRDVSLSTRIYDGTVQLQFDLTSDQGLEFGGWTIDDLCIVADPNAICGDGELNGLEQCDLGEDGNADIPDNCRTNCRAPRCGDAILDSAEECDDGNRMDEDGCTSGCHFPREDGGCCSTSDDPTRPIVPVAMVGLAFLVMRRRRRKA